MTRPTPLLICGMGRSGTRNAADVLNAHDEIHIHGEIPHVVLAGLFNTLGKADDVYLPHGGNARRGEDDMAPESSNNRSASWIRKKNDYILQSFGYLSKAGKGPLAELRDYRYVGHKTPKSEAFFERNEHHFAPAGAQPMYIYCARDAENCWRSYKAMPWNGKREVGDFIKEYTTSFERLRDMLKAAPERVIVLRLEDVIAATDKAAFYRKTVFTPLGLKLSPPVKKQLRTLQNRNATARVVGATTVELNDQELSLFAKNKALAEIKAEFFSQPYIEEVEAHDETAV